MTLPHSRVVVLLLATVASMIHMSTHFDVLTYVLAVEGTISGGGLGLDSYHSVREAEEVLPVEASGSPEGGVDGVQSVSGSDHHHLPPAVQPVHQS